MLDSGSIRHWLYGEDRPIVHLLVDQTESTAAGSYTPLISVSLRAFGLEQTKANLRSHRVEFEEHVSQEWPWREVVFQDPAEYRIGLTFEDEKH